jgi:hypothetical protein
LSGSTTWPVRVIPPEDFTYVYEHREAPPGTRVLLARYDDAPAKSFEQYVAMGGNDWFPEVGDEGEQPPREWDRSDA